MKKVKTAMNIDEETFDPMRGFEPKTFKYCVLQGNNAALIQRVINETFR
jgi:hypothetical protein